MYPILRDTPICHVALTIPDRSLCSKLQGSLSSSQGRRTSSLALKGISIWSSDMACNAAGGQRVKRR